MRENDEIEVGTNDDENEEGIDGMAIWIEDMVVEGMIDAIDGIRQPAAIVENVERTVGEIAQIAVEIDKTAVTNAEGIGLLVAEIVSKNVEEIGRIVEVFELPVEPNEEANEEIDVCEVMDHDVFAEK